MNRLTVVLGILAIGLVVLFINHDSGRSFGIENDQFGHLVTLLPIGAMLAAGILAGRRNLGDSMRQLMIWIVIILGLATLYLYRDDAMRVGDRLLAGLLPGRAIVVTNEDGDKEVVLHKSMNGHFQANVTVNGQSIDMLVDTGASLMALSQQDAERVGIIPENLIYSMTVMTANGIASAAPITLTEVTVGHIVRRNIRATVAEPGKLDQSLLGMSFLETLSSLQMQTDELRLRN